MRGRPAAAADNPSSSSSSPPPPLPALERVWVRSPAAAPAPASTAGVPAVLLLPPPPPLPPPAAAPPPNTVCHSSGVTPAVWEGTRSDTTLLAVAYLDRSSTSLGARLRGTPHPSGATGRADGGRLPPPPPLPFEVRCGCAFLPSSSTRPAMLRCWPTPGVPGPRGALGATPLPALLLPGDATAARGDGTACCCCCWGDGCVLPT